MSGMPEGRSAAPVQRQQKGPGQGPGPNALRWDSGGELVVATRERADGMDSAAVAAARDGEQPQSTHRAASHTSREFRGSLVFER